MYVFATIDMKLGEVRATFIRIFVTNLDKTNNACLRLTHYFAVPLPGTVTAGQTWMMLVQLYAVHSAVHTYTQQRSALTSYSPKLIGMTRTAYCYRLLCRL